jgi:glycine cleavage system aminomethyltransferase T
VLTDGTVIGHVTSGSFAPTLSQAIGFASVTSAQAHPGAHWLVDTGRTRLPARAIALPFIDKSA